MNYLSRYISLVLLMVIFGCTKTDQSELQRNYLKDKIDDYKSYRWRACEQQILQTAEAKSDSFFLAMAKQQTFDSTKAPQAIQRPQKPEVKIREDSVPLQPLLKRKGNNAKDTIAQDSAAMKN